MQKNTTRISSEEKVFTKSGLSAVLSPRSLKPRNVFWIAVQCILFSWQPGWCWDWNLNIGHLGASTFCSIGFSKPILLTDAVMYCNILYRTMPDLLATQSKYNTLILHKCTAVQCVQYAQYTHTPYHIASFSPLFLHTLQNSSMGHNVIEQKQSSALIQLCNKTSAE